MTSVRTRKQPYGEATVVNLSEGGVKLRTAGHGFVGGISLSAGDDVDLRFALPGSDEMLDIDGRVAWTSADACGVRFRYIPETQKPPWSNGSRIV